MKLPTHSHVERLASIHIALVYLKSARNALRGARAPKAAAAVRRAMKSAEGAERHAQGMLTRSRP